MWLQRSWSQRSPPAHRFRFAVSATHSPSQFVHKAVDAARGRMNVGRLTNKRDSTVLKEMLFDPPSGLELTDLYVCVMFARRCLLYPRSSLLLCFASPAVSQACLLAPRDNTKCLCFREQTRRARNETLEKLPVKNRTGGSAGVLACSRPHSHEKTAWRYNEAHRRLAIASQENPQKSYCAIACAGIFVLIVDFSRRNSGRNQKTRSKSSLGRSLLGACRISLEGSNGNRRAFNNWRSH